MTDAEVFERLSGVLREVFDDDALALAPEMSARDVEGWDSLANVRVILSVEEGFGIRFRASEVGRQENLGAFVQLIQAKLARA